MPLSEEQMQAIRDEEFFRNKVREDFGKPKAPKTFLERVSNFFETKTGFWILTTVLAGTAATAFTAVQDYLRRDEIRARKSAERIQSDMDTVIKLGPMLTSPDPNQIKVAIILLNGLTAKHELTAKDTNDKSENSVGNQVKALYTAVANPANPAPRIATTDGTTSGGSSSASGASAPTPQEVILAFADQVRLNQNQLPVDAPASTVSAQQNPVTGVLASTPLPPRVYLQIGSEEDRPRAVAARESLRKNGIVVPGIELVPRTMPETSDFRYCRDKVDLSSLAFMQAAINEAVSPPPRQVELPDRLCGKVRTNHYEIWFARKGK